MSQAERRFLGDIGDIHSELSTIPDGPLNFLDGVAYHNADVGDARIANRLDDAEEHWLVGHRNELLGAGVGQRIQAGTFTSAQNESFQSARSLL